MLAGELQQPAARAVLVLPQVLAMLLDLLRMRIWQLLVLQGRAVQE
jgi:hypothetical protein